MQLPAGLVRIVHSIDAQAHFEPQFRFVAQALGDLWQSFAADVQGQFGPLALRVHHDFLYGVVEFDTLAVQRFGQAVGNVVEIAAIRPRAAARQRDLTHQPPVSGRVTGAADAEHPAANVDHFFVGAGDRLPRVLVWGAHRSSPRISMVGLASSAASSASAMARSRLTPNGIS